MAGLWWGGVGGGGGGGGGHEEERVSIARQRGWELRQHRSGFWRPFGRGFTHAHSQRPRGSRVGEAHRWLHRGARWETRTNMFHKGTRHKSVDFITTCAKSVSGNYTWLILNRRATLKPSEWILNNFSYWLLFLIRIWLMTWYQWWDNTLPRIK